MKTSWMDGLLPRMLGVIAGCIACGPAIPRLAYVPSPESYSVAIFAVDAASGSLHHRGQTFLGVGRMPVALAISQKGFLYVANRDSNDVSSFRFDPTTGALSLLGQTAAGARPAAIALHPSEKFAYVANLQSGNVSAFLVDGTGALAPGVPNSPYPAGAQPHDIRLLPSGTCAFASADNGVFAYAVDASVGTLTPAPGPPVGKGGESIFVHPSGGVLFVSHRGSKAITSFAIHAGTCALTATTAAPASVTDPVALAGTPDGQFLYAASNLSHQIWRFSVSANGAMALLGTTAAGQHPGAISVDPTGAFLYTSNRAASEVAAFRIASDGSLAAADSLRAPVLPGAAQVATGEANSSCSPKALYVAGISKGVTAYAINETSGVLSSLGASSPGPGTGIAVDPASRLAVLATSASPDQLVTFSIASTNGALSQLQTTPVGRNPLLVAFEPTGRFVYVAVDGDMRVQGFRVGSGGTLTPTPGSPYPAGGTGVMGVVIDPIGYTAYVSNKNRREIWAYRIDQSTGELRNNSIPNSPFAVAGAPGYMSLHPSGRFLYVTSEGTGSGSVLAFHVDPVNGTLTPVSGSPFPVGSAPQGIAVHPSGRFAYVADFSTGIFPFSVDPATGVLAPLAPVASGAGCRSISIECSGKFIYAPCLTGLHGYAIDATNGTLVQIPGSPVSGAGDPFSSATSGTLK